MNLTQLRYLLAIVESDLNVTAAAERVHATQPGVSRQLKLLEEELGFQIFARLGKCLDHVTPEGEVVIRHARTTMAEIERMKSWAKDRRGEPDYTPFSNASRPAERCPKALSRA
jgi:LysR family cys regulon transcriptional activator